MSVDKNSVILNEVSEIVNADMPYFVKSDEAYKSLTAKDVTLHKATSLINSGCPEGSLTGVYETLSATPNDKNYVLDDNQLTYVDEAINVMPFHTWFSLVENSDVKTFDLVVADGIGVDEVINSSVNANSGVYDLSGRKVTSLHKKGIYIQKGKKRLF